MKRLIAVEPEVYEKLKRGTPVEKRVLSDLDRSMEKILQSNAPDTEKIKLYNEAMQKSLLYSKKTQKKPKPVVVKEKSQPVTEQALLKRYTKKSAAKKVLGKIQKNRSAGWDADGHFVLDGQAIPSSDITTLLHSAVKKRDATLPGWKEFESIQWQTL